MTATADAPALSELSEDQLASLYDSLSYDPQARAIIAAEGDRRDRNERARAEALQARRADPVVAEWSDAALAQFRQAEAACEGKLVRRGSKIIDAFSLWSGPEWMARKQASEELLNFWQDHPRIPTVTEWREHDREDIPPEDTTEGATMHAARDAGRVTEQAARVARYQQMGQAKAARMAGEARGEVAAPAQYPVALRAPIDGDRLLRDTRKFLRYFALWPSEEALNVATLTIAAYHAKDPEDGMPIWEYVAKLLFTALDYGAGKSWFAKLCAALCPDGIVLLEPTKPSIIDEIGMRKTVVITEVDELLATRGRNRGIVAVINGSYEPGHYHTRKRGDKVEEIHVFGPMILDGVIDPRSAIRKDLRAVISRSFVIQVHMAPNGYRRPRWDKEAREHAKRGRDRLTAWMAQEVAAGMEKDRPEMPGDLGNPRRCAMWEAVFTVALRADMCAARRDGREDDPEMYWSKAIATSAQVIEDALGLPYDDPDGGDQDESHMSDLDKALAEMED